MTALQSREFELKRRFLLSYVNQAGENGRFLNKSWAKGDIPTDKLKDGKSPKKSELFVLFRNCRNIFKILSQLSGLEKRKEYEAFKKSPFIRKYTGEKENIS